MGFEAAVKGANALETALVGYIQKLLFSLLHKLDRLLQPIDVYIVVKGHLEEPVKESGYIMVVVIQHFGNIGELPTFLWSAMVSTL